MKIKVLFYANSARPGITSLLNSIKDKHYDYSFIGDGDKWLGFGCKLLGVKKYVENYLDTSYTHIMMLDAFDVIILKSMTTFKEVYKQYFNEEDIIISAETNCYPNRGLIDEYPNSTYNETFRYVNAGSWIAPKEHIYSLCNVHPKVDDQGYFSRLYINQFTKSSSVSSFPKIILDHKCVLFQTMFGLSKDVFEVKEMWDLERSNYNVGKFKLYNNITKTEPCILHGNGKVDMSEIITKLKY
jgi:hypothetical protein